MAKVIESYIPKSFRNPSCVPLSPSQESLLSLVRRQRSQSGLDRLAGSLRGFWKQRSPTVP
jgi:hypothetical protein